MIHGGDIYSIFEKNPAVKSKLLDFSANINPLGIHSKICEAISNELSFAVHYPDPGERRLKDAVRKYLNKIYNTDFTRDCILFGNGAADVIYRLTLALKPKRALICAPTFAEYEESLALTNTALEFYSCPRETLAIEEHILECIHERLDIMFLCNPNNPTGLVVQRDLLEKIVEKTKTNDVFLVIDECFLDFIHNEQELSVIGLLSQNKHILVLKSFTKMYAMPGLRLGYGLCCNREIVSRMEKCGQPWPVSTVAEAAGIAALDMEDYPEKVRNYINEERQYLMAAFSRLSIHFFPSHANYILVQIVSPHDFYEQMLDQGILIRKCENYRNLDRTYYRVAVSSHENNECLIKALEQIFLVEDK